MDAETIAAALIIAVPIAALIVSVSTLVFAYIALRYKASSEYVISLETRLAFVEQELKDCRAECAVQARHNIELMKMIVEKTVINVKGGT